MLDLQLISIIGFKERNKENVLARADCFSHICLLKSRLKVSLCLLRQLAGSPMHIECILIRVELFGKKHVR